MGEADAFASVALAPEQRGHAWASGTRICVEAYRRVAARSSFGEVMPKSFSDGILLDNIIDPESMGLDGD